MLLADIHSIGNPPKIRFTVGYKYGQRRLYFIPAKMKNTKVGIATYTFAGERGEAHGCVFHRRKMRGVATNVYSRKTSEKPERY